MDKLTNLIPLFIAVPLLAAFAMPLLAKIWKGFAEVLALIVTLTISALIILIYFIGSLTEPVIYQIGAWAAPFGINFVLDGLSALLLLTIAVVSFAATLYSVQYMNKFTAKPKYFALLMLMITGMNGVVLTGDFFNMYVFVEIAAVASYALVAFGCESDELEASFKYMILGSVASALILLGIIFIYSMTGSLNMAHVSQLIVNYRDTAGILFPLALFIAGFGLKAALVPFHAWLPDAHPSAPAPISAMLSGVLIKAIGAYALIRIIFNVFGMTPILSSILMTLGSISMIVGVYLAIGQWDFKRLLAYHSISQMGYVILGIGLGTPLGILGGLFHLMNHASFKSLLFLNSGAVEYTTGTRDLQKMGGLAKKMPLTGATSMVASLSIAGIPPFNGFWSKLLIILAAVLSGHHVHAFFAVLVSVITLASFLKVQKYGFYGELKENLKNIKEAPWTLGAAMILLAAICLGVGLFYPYVVAYVLNPAVKALLDGTRYSLLILGS